MVTAFDFKEFKERILSQLYQSGIVVLLLFVVRCLQSLDEQVRTFDPVGHLQSDIQVQRVEKRRLQSVIAGEVILVRFVGGRLAIPLQQVLAGIQGYRFVGSLVEAGYQLIPVVSGWLRAALQAPLQFQCTLQSLRQSINNRAGTTNRRLKDIQADKQIYFVRKKSAEHEAIDGAHRVAQDGYLVPVVVVHESSDDQNQVDGVVGGASWQPGG